MEITEAQLGYIMGSLLLPAIVLGWPGPHRSARAHA